MSLPRAQVLERLAGFIRAATVAELAAACEQHPNTVREHLDALIEANLVTRSTAPAKGRGRPAILYQAQPLDTHRPQLREYAILGSALAHHIRHETDNPSDWGFQAGVGMGGRLVDVKDQTCEAANQAMVDIFEMHGFDPAICEDGFIRLRRCPILETARAYPEVVCALHDGVQSGIFAAHGCPGAAPHITPFAEPGACRVPAKGGPVMSTERAT